MSMWTQSYLGELLLYSTNLLHFWANSSKEEARL